MAQARGPGICAALEYAAARVRHILAPLYVVPLSEFGQKSALANIRGANFTLICLLDDRRRHGDHLLGTMHTKKGYCLGLLNTDTFLENLLGA